MAKLITVASPYRGWSGKYNDIAYNIAKGHEIARRYLDMGIYPIVMVMR